MGRFEGADTTQVLREEGRRCRHRRVRRHRSAVGNGARGRRMSAPERDHLSELAELSERVLEELRRLREETERQTDLLRQLLTQLTSLERSQYS
jgi:hypothetical protein